MSSEFMGKTYRRMDDMVLDANLRVTGDVTVEGTLAPTTDSPALEVATLTETGAIPTTARIVNLAHGSVVIEATLTPVVGAFYFIRSVTAGDVNHTVTLPGGCTWDGTNDVATFPDTGDALFGYFESATRFVIVVNTGGVTFS